MRINHIVVYVNYRFNAGENKTPAWKVVRCQVAYEDSEGWKLGRDLITPNQPVDRALAKTLLSVHNRVETVYFLFDWKLNRKPQRYTNMILLEIPNDELETLRNIYRALHSTVLHDDSAGANSCL